MQYLLRRCSEEGKTVAAAHLQRHTPADVYYECSKMDRVLKLSVKDRYIKVEPGLTLEKLNKILAG